MALNQLSFGPHSRYLVLGASLFYSMIAEFLLLVCIKQWDQEFASYLLVQDLKEPHLYCMKEQVIIFSFFSPFSPFLSSFFAFFQMWVQSSPCPSSLAMPLGQVLPVIHIQTMSRLKSAECGRLYPLHFE